MKTLLTSMIVVVLLTVPASARWGRSGDDLYGVADVIRAGTGAVGGLMAIAQQGRNYRLAEREQEFRFQQTSVQQRRVVPYHQLPNTAQGQRVSQLKEQQKLEQENAQLRQALDNSIVRERRLLERVNQLEREKKQLELKVSELEATVNQILERMQTSAPAPTS